LTSPGDKSVWVIVKILLMILLPLAWGLGSDLLFARLRSRKGLKKGIENISE